MIIDLVLESGIAFGVSTLLTFEHNGTAVRKDEASPDEENARLPERDLTIVDADQLRSLAGSGGSGRSGCHRHSR